MSFVDELFDGLTGNETGLGSLSRWLRSIDLPCRKRIISRVFSEDALMDSADCGGIELVGNVGCKEVVF